jgi:hypothetical protein
VSGLSLMDQLVVPRLVSCTRAMPGRMRAACDITGGRPCRGAREAVLRQPAGE